MSELEDIKHRLELIETRLKETDDKPMNIQEAASYLGFSVRYIYRLTYQKKIPFTKPMGKVLFFTKRSLDEWVKGKAGGRRSEFRSQKSERQVESKQ